MTPIFPERLPELWQTGHLHLNPNPIAYVPKRVVITLVIITMLTGKLFLVTLGVVTWNILAGLRNRLATGF